MIFATQRLLSAVTILVLTVACTPSKPVTDLPDGENRADLFSNRPIGAVPDVYVITLKEPPLLTSATKSAQGWIVPEAAKRALLNEQAQFAQALRSTAPKAQIVFRYRMTLNAMAVYAPPESLPQVQTLAGVKSVSPVRQMSRPEMLNVNAQVPQKKLAGEVNSSTFIGAEAAYAQGLRGQGMRVGIIDTGIDYTHAMLGGSGQPQDFEMIQPALPTPAFPNAKVVGGIDLAGSDFDAASPNAIKRLPRPDGNPIDEAGHGTHVAGTVAGKGDGINSYDGVAPDAQLYGIKVFGRDGSTMDAVVIAGFEFAADPNGDLNPDDQLDVINLSLGGGFGQPQILYAEAVRNLSRAGTVVIASAGNSGPIDYIVGAPGTSDEALSVAASIDGSKHNWQFAAVRFVSPNNPKWMAKATEGPISKPISEAARTEGELVDIGMGDVDLTEEVKARLAGKIALISRGKVAFAEKLQRAFDGGAIGAVVYNNEPGQPIPMGGEGKVDIPAIMVSQALGMKLVEEMKLGPVTILFQSGEMIEEPELIDSITDFSSKGPRSEDNLLKPEIAAPGQQVISAAMGGGQATVRMDGTSMSAPHMSGAMALIKQARPNLSAAQLKSLAMNSSKILSLAGKEVPISLQGAGRVQIDRALTTPVVTEPASLSLGGVAVGAGTTQTKTLTVRNITGRAITLDIVPSVQPGLELRTSLSQLRLEPNAEATVSVEAQFTLTEANSFALELNGRVLFKEAGQVVAQVPALAIRTQASLVSSVAAAATSPIALTNSSPVDGMALAFNLLGQDARKREPASFQSWKSRACDLESVGYRILNKPTPQGDKPVLQFGFKMYKPATTWHYCEVNVQIDANEDGVTDQEFAGVSSMSLEGVAPLPFFSVLLDAAKARDIRLAYERRLLEGNEEAVNYMPAVVGGAGMAPFAHSTLTVIEMPVELLAKTADGKLNIKVASLAQGGDAIEADDFLGEETLGAWTKIPTVAAEMPFSGMSEFSAVTAAGGAISFTRGPAPGKMIIYYPMNAFTADRDNQSLILE